MARRTSTRRIRRRIIKPKDCPFCKLNEEPDFKDVEKIRHYISERGKILPRTLTGICQKHQLRLSRSIKQSRYMALLPFVVRPV
ncbi:30S ribosomal protein S18 [Candidatus Gottesmanbacteria bacterium RIFCSPHIGHO2_02_FULL_40_24]|uniref:Small ribosomal subunit protein bS18 n=1 Tax=Candidatus Gottesmanbacteria bacterium RIFCSPHIGHO2_01_FULL_40_15 TaxID=1798376 RepID=A0A1F5Z1R8_9BACT|nr:MAG: 30S ribosomal protein S18 [Candidatus Gottesmanbacteria bacterium RIFCSPHIGHO2_01_FULL_40_15]OGG17494.1 MAG: 30S ribosomal protein S18 [Candidatus Gottesmanbacteria bacterium RIFCSPHIGHO2_02_FULL_40_24]OGG21501.1 MAG: 30S ribosomal protein S18 [Candidatus Gottesmanbacteria bacterium RIFCSPLOWO2_01_FULL_40_10]OGG25137.1 MAG: 30S ribosomal protein S18 [Candidatus Gottesmanbacteria bacterium RIFCSPHIGHO2_12_FULL_40_13]OGG32743.1 MAG: 30S ribosomal protein S18 [Candidatus Gottesmanbacteria 